MPIMVGFCHIGWEKCGHGLTCRPRETSGEGFLDGGSLKPSQLRFCPWNLGACGQMVFLMLILLEAFMCSACCFSPLGLG